MNHVSRFGCIRIDRRSENILTGYLALITGIGIGVTFSLSFFEAFLFGVGDGS
jgi:hypothetical protein